MNRGLLAAGGIHSQPAAFERLLWDRAAPRDGDGSGVAVVLGRIPRSSTVPCIGAVPTWGASVGTGPRPSVQAAPWACRRWQTRTHAYSRTPRVGPLCCLLSVGVWGSAGRWECGVAACAEPSLDPCRATSFSGAVFRRGGGGGASEPPDTDVLGHQGAESQPLSWPEPISSEGTICLVSKHLASWTPFIQPSPPHHLFISPPPPSHFPSHSALQ